MQPWILSPRLGEQPGRIRDATPGLLLSVWQGECFAMRAPFSPTAYEQKLCDTPYTSGRRYPAFTRDIAVCPFSRDFANLTHQCQSQSQSQKQTVFGIFLRFFLF